MTQAQIKQPSFSAGDVADAVRVSIGHAVAKYPELMPIHATLENLADAQEELAAAENAATTAEKACDEIINKIDDFITAANL